MSSYRPDFLKGGRIGAQTELVPLRSDPAAARPVVIDRNNERRVITVRKPLSMPSNPHRHRPEKPGSRQEAVVDVIALMRPLQEPQSGTAFLCKDLPGDRVVGTREPKL